MLQQELFEGKFCVNNASNSVVSSVDFCACFFSPVAHVLLLCSGAAVSVVVDAAGPLEQLAAAAASWGVSINVLVEINAGQDRWSVGSGGLGGCEGVCLQAGSTFLFLLFWI